MRKWLNRMLGREGQENSARTQAELNHLEKKLVLYEKRVEHLRRERALYENRKLAE